MEPENWNDDAEPWIDIPSTIRPASRDRCDNLPLLTDGERKSNAIDPELWDDGEPELEIETTIKPSSLNRVNLKDNPIYEDELEDEFCNALKVGYCRFIYGFIS
jgi:hypothetical protein